MSIRQVLDIINTTDDIEYTIKRVLNKCPIKYGEILCCNVSKNRLYDLVGNGTLPYDILNQEIVELKIDFMQFEIVIGVYLD